MFLKSCHLCTNVPKGSFMYRDMLRDLWQAPLPPVADNGLTLVIRHIACSRQQGGEAV